MFREGLALLREYDHHIKTTLLAQLHPLRVKLASAQVAQEISAAYMDKSPSDVSDKFSEILSEDSAAETMRCQLRLDEAIAKIEVEYGYTMAQLHESETEVEWVVCC